METIDNDASLYDLIETRFGEDMAKYLGILHALRMCEKYFYRAVAHNPRMVSFRL